MSSSDHLPADSKVLKPGLSKKLKGSFKNLIKSSSRPASSGSLNSISNPAAEAIKEDAEAIKEDAETTVQQVVADAETKTVQAIDGAVKAAPHIVPRHADKTAEISTPSTGAVGKGLVTLAVLVAVAVAIMWHPKQKTNAPPVPAKKKGWF